MFTADMFRRDSRRKILYFLYVLCFLCMFSGSRSDDMQILMKLKAVFQKSNTDVFDSWRFDYSVCNFSGILCNLDGNVTGIELSDKNLIGILSLDSICELQSLEKLSLGRNFLYGSITEDLKNCSRLKHLDLSLNSFSGKLPELSSLSGLEVLNLNNSGFSGHFPWSSVSNLTNLVSLSIGDNKFDSNLFPVEVLKLKKLNTLYLSNCSIEGRIPAEIGNLTELISLELASNSLSGEIPSEISNLVKLWQLQLYENELTGKFPFGFRNLTNLSLFDASDNKLEGDLSDLKFLTKLVSLQLFENQFTGEVPQEFGDFMFLTNLSLYRNKLTGSLPSKLGSWTYFDFIDVSENYLTGPIPPDMCKNGRMTELLMLQNRFTGNIPANYGNCVSLVRLRINNNSLSGNVPSGIWGLPNIEFIDLTSNQFEGPITSDIENAKSLGQLLLGNNRFSGKLPSEISKASSIVSIDLSLNQFSGEIPESIGELKKLSSLLFQGNLFSGAIPDTLASCTSLNEINFAENSLSGSIPSSLGILSSLNFLNLSNNKISGQIPLSLASLKLSLIDLSNNRLTGRVPEALSVEAYNGSFAGNPQLCNSDIRYFQPCSSDSGKSSNLRTLIACFTAGTAVMLISLACYLFVKKRNKNQENPLKSDSWKLKSFRVLSFTEQEILNSIKQENLIGKGGSGNVYKVVLSNGKELAVKHIWNSDSGGLKISGSSTAMLNKRPGKSPEFDAEVATLSSIRHVNVVKLYCSITSEDSNLLVYEYLPNGSLWDRLHTCRKIELDWEARYEIALGAAKGLEYLHHGCERPIIHRDVKSSNILLDEFLKSRIADFGLAKTMQTARSRGWDSSSTHVIAGTHGYIAPEYAYTYKVNEKSDVYSFGVVLMELVTGKKPIEVEFGENKDIVHWVYSKGKSKERLMELVDESISEVMKEDAVKMLRIGILCTAKLPVLRPSMRAVVLMLEEAEPFKLISVNVTSDEGCRNEE